MSPVRQGMPTVSVPYLIRPKLGCSTVSTDRDLRILGWRLGEDQRSVVLSRNRLPSLSVDLVKLPKSWQLWPE